MDTNDDKYVTVQISQCRCFVTCYKIEGNFLSGEDIFDSLKRKFKCTSPVRWSVSTPNKRNRIWSVITNIKKIIFNENTRLRYDGFEKKWSSSETVIFVENPGLSNQRKWSPDECPCKVGSFCRRKSNFCEDMH